MTTLNEIIIIISVERNIYTASLVYELACLTTDHEVVGSISGTSTNLKTWIRSGTGSTEPREDNWVAALLRSSGSD